MNTTTSNTNSFIFLVDISGFTNFVNQTEIEHSGHIIAELLESVIDSNELGMTVAEVEGDAVFFYKHHDIPSKEDLLKQIEKTFIDFHYHLQLYEKRRVCHCGACSTAPNLTLKFIAHAGDFSFISVKGNQKPYGKDIILAHRLLKNDVPIKDYALFSRQLQNNWDLQSDLSVFLPEQTDYQDIGLVHYNYFKLDYLKKQVPVIDDDTLIGSKIHKPIVSEIDLKFPIEYVYQSLVNMDQRKEWVHGAEKVLFDPKELNRLGAKHQCIVDGQFVEFETVTNNFGDGRWVYGERTSSVPLVRESTTYFILDEIGDGQTRLTVETHYKRHPIIGWLLIPIFKHLITKGLKLSLNKFSGWLSSKRKIMPASL